MFTHILANFQYDQWGNSWRIFKCIAPIAQVWPAGDLHYGDVIMGAIASQITSLTIVHSTVYSDADQRKHQSSASLAFVLGIHRDRCIPRTNGQLHGKCFHLITSSCDESASPAAMGSFIPAPLLKDLQKTSDMFLMRQMQHICFTDDLAPQIHLRHPSLQYSCDWKKHHDPPFDYEI